MVSSPPETALADSNQQADPQQQQQPEEEEKEEATIDWSLLEPWIDNDIVKHDNPLKPQKVFHQQLLSRDAFQSRLQTFLPLTYYCKPNSLSPLVCSRFGYVIII